ncbi:hypothetical protein SD70_32030 [Gordoniibacillus kamchatkensis]|uniref:Uncharacterized protein n=1 Tax=Gordoniibacillus kamchatkensis TaxID=1590651 RepID=A0ABR5A3V0_9BACL|nr:hypothetical protein SD70_32030 [Paenibacillus sp. VKM B-2647]
MQIFHREGRSSERRRRPSPFASRKFFKFKDGQEQEGEQERTAVFLFNLHMYRTLALQGGVHTKTFYQEVMA